MRSIASALIFAMLGVACASASPRPPRHLGDAEAEPAIEVLPSRDAEEAPLSARMRFAMVLAEESLGLTPPTPPLERNAHQLSQWTETALAAWLRRKSHTVEAARRELDRASDEAHHQRIIAGALVGLMYEDVALVLGAVPVPADLDSEPEIAEMYRDVVDFQASPWREHARAAYSACARNAIEPDHMRHWSVFCYERAERLPPPRAMPTREGTVVEVSVDPDAI